MDLKFYYHTSSFWVKEFLAVTIIITTIILKNNITPLIVKIRFFSIVFFLSLYVLGSGNVIEAFWIGFTLKKNEEQDLDDSIIQLSRNMGCTFSTYFTVQGFHSAFVFRGKQLVIGESVRKLLLQNELNAILAHEFSHETREKVHDKILIMGLGLTFVFYSLFFLRLPFFLSGTVMLACLYLIMSIFLWYRECDCDENAIKYVLVDDFANGLTKVYEGKFNAFSFFHPSPKFRINRLKTRAQFGDTKSY